MGQLWQRVRDWIAGPRPLSFRYERFGGIVQLRWPRALIFVDQARARRLGYATPPPDRWPAEDDEGDDFLRAPLSAPLEAHLQLTNRCAVGCQGCYTGATAEGGPREWGLSEWCRAIDELAAAGVFHLALGGGESALLPWLGELLIHARSRGLWPNLTTSGLYDEDTLARVCGYAAQGLFGQINVSLDGLGPAYAAVRGVDGFAQADRALRALRARTPRVGINVVLTKAGFADLEGLFRYARQQRLNEVEILRFKPAGRGARAGVYESLRCTDEQHQALLPTVLRLARRHRVRARLDCSLTPFVVHHRPAPRLLRWLSIYGCAGGDLLVAAKPGGSLAPCSFAPTVAASADGLRAYWQEADAFPPFRTYRAAQAPCQSCEYLALCRGGCRVVSAHVGGDAAAPDPECPRVLAFQATEGAPPSLARGPRRLPVVSGQGG